MSEELIDAMVNMQEQKALEIAKEMITDGEDPEILLRSMRRLGLGRNRMKERWLVVAKLMTKSDAIQEQRLRASTQGIPFH